MFFMCKRAVTILRESTKVGHVDAVGIENKANEEHEFDVEKKESGE